MYVKLVSAQVRYESDIGKEIAMVICTDTGHAMRSFVCPPSVLDGRLGGGSVGPIRARGSTVLRYDSIQEQGWQNRCCHPC